MNDLSDYMNMPHKITLKLLESVDEHLYIAKIPELSGCISHGNTAKEALDNIRDAKRCWIETALFLSREVPSVQNGALVVEILGSYTEKEKQELEESVDRFLSLLSSLE